jgi:hypothetical protein
MAILKISVSNTLMSSHESIAFKRFELSGQPFYRLRGIKLIFKSIGNFSSSFESGFINSYIKFFRYISPSTKAKFAST